MAYQVLARKWRPQNFDQIAGQETITRALRNALLSGRIAHAFLFSGVRGVGKTTTARVLAKALNCESGPTDAPCSKCVSCTEIAAATSLDVLEIDAASNTGVDNIRDLRENTRYAPARDRFKIFIIDEVHMLSNAAFNALLKTLEEPPSHVKFILATTEHHRIPVTITSRCQEYTFKPIPLALIIKHLNHISINEEIEISDYGIRVISSAAQGSMRDAQSVLDQITSLSGKQVSDEDVRVMLGVIDERLVTALVDCVQQHNAKDLLEQMLKATEAGIDTANLVSQILAHLRNLMVFQISGWDERLLQLPDSQKEVITRQSRSSSAPDLIRFFDVMTRCEGELRWHTSPLLHLEMTFMKLIELASLPRLESVLERLQSGQIKLATNTKNKSQEKPPQFQAESALPAVTNVESDKPLTTTTVQEQGFRSRLLDAIQAENTPLHLSLQQSTATHIENGKVTMVFPTSEKIHADLVQSKASRISELSQHLVGSPCQLQIKLEDSESLEPVKKEDDPMENPKVKAFLEQFPGKVIIDRSPEE